MTRREFFPLLAGPILAQPLYEIPVRTVVILRDISPSFKNAPPITKTLSEIIHKLGPGDVVAIIELGGPFSPEACVKVQCTMPHVPPGLLAPVRRPDDWRRNQARLNGLWHRVEMNQRSIEAYLDVPPPVKAPTPLFEALAYSAAIMKTAAGSRKLVVISDFVQDSGGVKSSLPPKELMDLAGVSSLALFVPWQRGFSKRVVAWRHWFVASGASDFEMLDGAQSQVRQALDQSAVPRVLPQRF